MIWDVAGNVQEWVKDNNTVKYVLSYISQIAPIPSSSLGSVGSRSLASVSDSEKAKNRFGSLEDYRFLNVAPYGGLGWLSFTRFSEDSNEGTILRGGAWNFGSFSGVFTANLYTSGLTKS